MGTWHKLCELAGAFPKLEIVLKGAESDCALKSNSSSIIRLYIGGHHHTRTAKEMIVSQVPNMTRKQMNCNTLNSE